MSSQDKITYFAETDHRNKKVKFGIKAKDRTRHMYVIGKTGMGKSTLLENLAIQDIQNGEGIAFIDPHGSTAEKLLDYVPEHRVKDVVYFAPFDVEYPVAFNVMEDIGVDKRHFVVSGLMSAFKKIWVDAWSARMEYILSNILVALLETPGSTLLGANRMLTDKDYRKKIVDNIKDPSVKAFWTEEYAKYTERFAAEAAPAIQNKVGQLTANPLIRNIIGQTKSSFDLRKVMDEKKIFIANLSIGKIGEGNANLIGSMLITKMYLAAMSRADVPASKMKDLPNFYFYVDEFQNFANESFAEILSQSRKYNLNLTVAHQYVEQMTDEVKAAVFGNVGTMISFRVGSTDAEIFEKEFAPEFLAEDLVNLGFAQIYLRLMIDGIGSKPFSATTLPPEPMPTISYTKEIIEMSRKQWASPRAKVEEEIKKWFEPVIPVDERERRKSEGMEKRRPDGDRVRRENQNGPRREGGQMSRHEPRHEPGHEPRRENHPTEPNKPRESENQTQIPLPPTKLASLRPEAPNRASLNSLKHPPKTSSAEHTFALKKAIEEAIKEKEKNVPKENEIKSEPIEAKPADLNKNVPNSAPENPNKQREVPEDVLKKVLGK